MNTAVRVFYRTCSLLLRPDEQWTAIAAERRDRKDVFMHFVLPMLCLIAVCVIVGSVLYISREVFSPGFVLRRILLSGCLLSAGLYLSAFLIDVLLLRPRASALHEVFALTAYSSAAAYVVIAVVSLFPFFDELLVLALYSGYLYRRGVPFMLDVPAGKQSVFAALSLLIAAAVHLPLFYFLDRMLDAVF
ncbi:MAG: YIP1 family protein [Bacteroidales bacterium]|jgi:hypothetical protein|nr:YIP1 family protein [Bacteroidales bacterium]